MKIKITGDSTLDLTPELLAKYNISLVSLEVTLGTDSFLDGVNITREDIYAYEKRTGNLPKTAARSAEVYKEFFESFTSQGYAVIHFSISSKISASNQSAVQAASQLSNVYVIDTLALSTGSALLALYACELAGRPGADAKAVYETVSKRVPDVQTSFIIDTLHYLHKGGRCTKLQLLGANLFKIKPTILMKDGQLDVGVKFRGPMHKVILNYVDGILDKFNIPDTSRVFVTHTDTPAEIVAMVKQRLVEFGFQEILETTAGSTVTSHCGKGTLGILYINGKQ